MMRTVLRTGYVGTATETDCAEHEDAMGVRFVARHVCSERGTRTNEIPVFRAAGDTERLGEDGR
jgi:hypothetical protein